MRRFFRIGPRASLVMAIALMLLWVVGRQQILRMDDSFFQPSFAGARGLALYMTGNYGGAARAYGAHFRGLAPASARAPDDALLVGDLDSAERLAREVLARTPTAVGPLLTLGEVALERGALDQALALFKEALQRQRDHVDALLLFSVALARLRASGEAIDAINRALRHNSAGSRLTGFLKILELTGELAGKPRGERPLCLLAHYYRYLRIFDPSNARIAVAYAEKAVASGDRPADAYLTIGVIYERQGNRERALVALRKAIEVNPKHAEAYRWSAFVYSERGDQVNEYRMIKAAFEAAPDDPFYINHLDHVLVEKLGDPYQAVALLEKAVEISPDNVRAHERLGYAYGFIGDHARAVAHYQRAIRLEPANPRIYEGLGWTLDRLQQPEEAIAAFKQAAGVAPGWYQPHSSLAGVYHQTRQYRQAIAEYETALRLGERSVEKHAYLCAVYHAASEFQKAVECFQAVLRRDPQNPLAIRLLPESTTNSRLQRARR